MPSQPLPAMPRLELAVVVMAAMLLAIGQVPCLAHHLDTLRWDDPGLMAPGPAGATTQNPSALENPGFEQGIDPDGSPPLWLASSGSERCYEIALDAAQAHGGRSSARIRSIRKVVPEDAFGTLTQELSAAAYKGKRVRLSGWLRSRQIAPGFGGLWMRVDGSGSSPLAFDNMSTRGVHGTSAWKQYEVVLDVPPEAKDIALGALLAGHGTLWVDDLKLEVVAKTVPTTLCQCSPKP